MQPSKCEKCAKGYFAIKGKSMCLKMEEGAYFSNG